MKNYTFIGILLLISSFSFAQNVPIDFESGGNGRSWTWTTFENDDNPPLEVVANPSKVAPNTSDSVAKFIARAAGNPWAGCESQHGSDIGKFTLSASTSTIKIMVYKTVISDVGIKLVENSGAALPELKVPNTKTNEWEELTFDFSSREGIEYDQIVVFMDFQARTTETISYFDNITFGPAPTVPEPMTAAADPSFPEANVISMFCGVYTDVTVDTWRTPWSNGTLTDVQVAGNDVKKYSALDFVGIETVGANLIDASSMEHINFDMWTPNSTVFKIKIVDFGADKAFGGGDDTEHQIVFTAPAKEEWVNYRIPLSDFTGLTNTSNIAQIILNSEPIGSSIIYIDNVVFSKGSGASVANLTEFNSFNVYPNPATENVNVDLEVQNGIILNYSIINVSGQEMFNEQVNAKNVSKSINTSAFGSGIYFIKVVTENGSYTNRLIIQ